MKVLIVVEETRAGFSGLSRPTWRDASPLAALGRKWNG